MKKSLVYAMILLAAVACNKERFQVMEPRPLAEGEVGVQLTARIAAPTKVEFDDIYGHFTWSEMGDSISVHVTNGIHPVSGKEMVPAGYKKGVVSPLADAGVALDDDNGQIRKFYFVMSEGQQRDYYAIYPSSVIDEENYGNTELKVNLPASYEIDADGMGTYCPTPMVAVNDPSSSYLDFRHVGGLLRLTLNDVSPATASIEVSMGKRLTGSFTVNDPATSIPYIATDDNADVVTFVLSEPLTAYTDGLIINVPVPTGTYESLTVKAKNGNGEVVYTYEDEKSRTFETGRGRRTETVISSVAIPLCFEAIEDGAVTIDNPKALTIEYSFDNKNWTAASDERIYIPVSEGDCVYFRGNNEKYSQVEINPENLNDTFSPVAGAKFGCDGKCYVYGNVMSLIDAEHFPDRTDFTQVGALAFLFSGATDIVLHPEKSLELPATTLTPACYAFMFQNCSSLVTAPALPARTLAPGAYIMMFDMCSSLATAPELPATELDEACYEFMFESCTSLTKTPELPAPFVPKDGYAAMFLLCTGLEEVSPILASEMGEEACAWMFNNCSSLTKVPVLPAMTLGKDCYSGMFYDCPALVTVPSDMLPATTLPEGCYEGMFQKCTSLTSPPKLPATTLTEDCYNSMFEKCYSLTKAPDLPATTLAEGCYQYMFENCTSLTEVPEILPATSLAKDCCYYMFYNCSSLTAAPELPATTLADHCYYKMFSGCTSLVHAPEILPATTLANNCYAEMFRGCTLLTTAPVLVDANCSGMSMCYDMMFYGCTSLNYVKAMFLTFPSGTYSWLYDVSSTGTFVMNTAATWNPYTDAGVPSGWTVETATE